MAAGVKTGGRKAGTPNKPKAEAPDSSGLPLTRARAREAAKKPRVAASFTVETWPIGRLVEYARNPRKNDDQLVDRMAGAIREFGFRIPIVAKSDGTIVDGHLRFKAARKLGMTEVPVALADGLTDAQVRAFRLLANKSANWASWDDDLLRVELDELRDDGFDLSLSGFDSFEIAALIDEPELPEPEPESEGRKASLEERAVRTTTITCPDCGHQFTK